MTEHVTTIEPATSAPSVADKIAAAAAQHRAAMKELGESMIRGAADKVVMAQISRRSFRARAMGEASPYGLLGFAPVFSCGWEEPRAAADDLSKMTAEMLASGTPL